jgi:hypothetical protein
LILSKLLHGSGEHRLREFLLRDERRRYSAPEVQQRHAKR